MSVNKSSAGESIPSPISIFVLGMSLGLFLVITFIVCIVFDLLFPEYAMYPAWQRYLPGFTWLSWPSFFLGIVETFAYGWYVAIVFGPIYNILSRRSAQIRRETA